MMFQRWALVLLLPALLAACNNEKVRNLMDKRAEQVEQGLKEATKPTLKKSYDPLTVSEKVWAGNASLRLRRGVPLPGKYEGSRGVTLISAEPMSLTDIAAAVTAQTGIPVRVAPGADTAVSAASGGAVSSAMGMPSTPSSASLPPPGSFVPPSTSSSSTVGGMPLAFEGSLSNLLDQVAAFYGVTWRYDGSSINFSRYETRVFMIEALPGTQTTKDGMKEDSGSGGSSSSASSGGGSTNSLTQTSDMNVEIKFWDELKETMNALLGGVGSLVVSPSSGTITVTTTPEVMQTVSKFLQEENKRLSKQIAINVEVYKVELSQGTDFNFAFNEALRSLVNSGDFTGTYGGPIGSNLVSSALSESVTPASLSVAILNPNGNNKNGVRGVFTALSGLGDTSRVAQFPLTTLSNRPVSRRVGRNIAYLEKVESQLATGTTTSSTSTVTLTPNTVREGFSLQLVPRLLDDGRIMLQYSLSITDLIGLTTYETPDKANSIQLPETKVSAFVQQSMLKSGSTLIIGGVDDEQAAQNAQGVGSPFNFLLGGGSSNYTSHSMIFIAITPQVLDVPHSEQE